MSTWRRRIRIFRQTVEVEWSWKLWTHTKWNKDTIYVNNNEEQKNVSFERNSRLLDCYSKRKKCHLKMNGSVCWNETPELSSFRCQTRTKKTTCSIARSRECRNIRLILIQTRSRIRFTVSSQSSSIHINLLYFSIHCTEWTHKTTTKSSERIFALTFVLRYSKNNFTSFQQWHSSSNKDESLLIYAFFAFECSWIFILFDR